MARTPAKDKVYSIGVDTLKSMNEWGERLEAVGFQPTSFQYDRENVVSVTCEKNGREQVITPELLEVIAKD